MKIGKIKLKSTFQSRLFSTIYHAARRWQRCFCYVQDYFYKVIAIIFHSAISINTEVTFQKTKFSESVAVLRFWGRFLMNNNQENVAIHVLGVLACYTCTHALITSFWGVQMSIAHKQYSSAPPKSVDDRWQHGPPSTASPRVHVYVQLGFQFQWSVHGMLPVHGYSSRNGTNMYVMYVLQ